MRMHQDCVPFQKKVHLHQTRGLPLYMESLLPPAVINICLPHSQAEEERSLLWGDFSIIPNQGVWLKESKSPQPQVMKYITSRVQTPWFVMHFLCTVSSMWVLLNTNLFLPVHTLVYKSTLNHASCLHSRNRSFGGKWQTAVFHTVFEILIPGPGQRGDLINTQIIQNLPLCPLGTGSSSERASEQAILTMAEAPSCPGQSLWLRGRLLIQHFS